MLALGFILLFVASAAGETAYLESLNSDTYRRTLDQSETLNFRLRHSGGDIELNLEENTNLNANAPIFLNRHSANGDSVAVPVRVPHNSMKFFQDKRNGAYVRSSCLPSEHGPCFNSLEGNVLIRGKEYKLEPATSGADKRHAALGVPHTLEVLERVHSTGTHQTHTGRGIIVTSNDDYVIREDEEKNEDVSEIGGLTEAEIDRVERLLARLQHRSSHDIHKRQTASAHGIEMVFAVDHLIYQRFAAIHNGLGVEGILQKVREYFSHIINGVDLRYVSIEDPNYSFYVRATGFVISTQVVDSPWLDYSGSSTDGLAGLEFMRTWRRDTGGLPKHDHAAFMTGSDIQAGGSTGVAGIAYLDGVCTFWGVSINEELGFFKGAGVLAHELGHNLGALHDAGDTDSACDVNADFVMAPFVPSLSAQSTTINPWRFSSCSIDSFKSYVNSLGTGSCTLDTADIYDPEEFDTFNSTFAGQLYTEDEQCELLRGAGATFCTGNRDSQDVCRRFGCSSADSNSCFRYVAAQGTSCGNGRVCFEGICQLETTNPPTNRSTNSPTKPTTTDAPSTNATTLPSTTTEFPSTPDGLNCFNYGRGGQTCSELRVVMGNKKRLCSFFASDCCKTCQTVCKKDKTVRGRERYTCDDLINIFGLNTACDIFAYECCFTCHKSKR